MNITIFPFSSFYIPLFIPVNSSEAAKNPAYKGLPDKEAGAGKILGKTHAEDVH